MSLKPTPRDAFPDRREVPLVGATDAIRALDEQIDRAARSDAKVLITGETGSGKEVVARQIHYRSARRSMPLVTLNCAGVPESLLESELFGHVRGAFTGAMRDKRGLFETAGGGTVFLDEIGEMSLRMQAVLLRFLQSGEIQRVGADRSHARVNVRLICATNRDLRQEVAAGTFREDFYFRLNVVTISVPPLRERLSDVPLLVDFFLGDLVQPGRPVSLAPDTLDLLTKYSWPGNVRELRNVLERLVVNARGTVVTADELPEQLLTSVRTPVRATSQSAANTSVIVNELAGRMLVHGESFWSVVAVPLAAHQLSRDDVKKIVRLGLERTKGSYRHMVDLFNMPADDHARFLNFLQEHDCHLPPVGLRSDGRLDQRGRGPASEKN